MIEIIYPSDIKIKITEITDGSGSPVVIPDELPYLKFIFADEFGGFYECVYDPQGTDTKGVKYNEDEGYLAVTITDYKMKGALKYKVGVKLDDADFSAGKWRFFGDFVELDAKVVLK